MTDFSLEGHITYRLRNARIENWPFPHFFVDNIFPDDVYWQLHDAIRRKDDYSSGDRNYNGRKFAEAVDIPILDFMQTPAFAVQVAKVFMEPLQARFHDRPCRLTNDLRLVRDGENYHIGPHTDAKWKVASLLFYMPLDGWNSDVGTSIYLPKDRDFRCPGGPHHKFEDFDRIYTAPYVPNSCFGFFKTDNSFHGVEPITKPICRDVLLFNLYEGALNSQSDNA